MASNRQAARDAASRSRGFRNYYDERNHKARLEGYSSYNEQRRARRTGVGLRGKDRPTRRAEIPRQPPRYDPPRFIPERPSGSQANEELIRGLRSRYQLTAAQVKSSLLEGVTSERGRRGTARIARTNKDILKLFGTEARQDLDAVERFYNKNLPLAFTHNYRTGYLAGNPLKNYDDIDIDPEARDLFLDLQKNGLQDARQSAIGAERSLKRTMNDMELVNVRSQRRMAKKDSLKAVTFGNGARWDYDKFMEMSLRANAQRASNVGYVRGAIRGGVKLFEIVDGGDCGLTSHNDGTKANGMIVDSDTALEHPIAHPNCVRTFVARPDLSDDPNKIRQGVKKAIKAYAGAVVRESLEATIRASLQKAISDHNVEDRVMQWAASRGSEWPFRFQSFAQQTGQTPTDLIRDFSTYLDDFAAGRVVPAHIYRIIQMAQDVPAKAVGDEFDRWGDWYSRTVQATMSGLRPEVDGLIHDPNVRNAFFNSFYDAVGGVPSNPGEFIRWSAPRIKGKTTGTIRRPRLTLVGKEAVKATITRTDKGFINHIRMNPNGLLRAGFSQIEGVIVPNISLIPKGPIRIVTRINRGTKGNITSLSTEVRVITPKWAIRTMNDVLGLTENGVVVSELGKAGVNFSATLNLNLRQLGLRSLTDIRNLSLEDYRKLKQRHYFNPITEEFEEHDTFKIVSLATQMRLRGANFVDIAHTWRVPWEDAVAYWNMTNLELRLAEQVRKLEKILAARDAKRIKDITEVIHPYSRAQSKARPGANISLFGTTQEIPQLDWRMVVYEGRPVETWADFWNWAEKTHDLKKEALGVQGQKDFVTEVFRKNRWTKLPPNLIQDMKDRYGVDVYKLTNEPREAQRMQPLEDVPFIGPVQPKAKKARNGTKAPGPGSDKNIVPEIAPKGEVLVLARDWGKKMFVPKNTTIDTDEGPIVGSFGQVKVVETVDELWDWLEINRGVRREDRDLDQQGEFLRRFFRRGLWFNMPNQLKMELFEMYDLRVHTQRPGTT